MVTVINKQCESMFKSNKVEEKYYDHNSGQIKIKTAKITPVSKLKEEFPGATESDIFRLYNLDKLHFYTVNKTLVIKNEKISFLTKYEIKDESINFVDFLNRNDICILNNEIWRIKIEFKDLSYKQVEPFGHNINNSDLHDEIDRLNNENIELKNKINNANNTIKMLQEEILKYKSDITELQTNKKETWRDYYPVCALIADLHEKGKKRYEIVDELINKYEMRIIQVGGLTNPRVGYIKDGTVKKRVYRDKSAALQAKQKNVTGDT